MGRLRGQDKLGSRFLQPSDEVVTVLVLLETSEGHFSARDVLLGVLKVLEEGLLSPSNALVDVGGSVGEPLDLASLATKEPMEVGADLVGLACTDGMALSAASLEETGTLASVTRSVRHVYKYMREAESK